MTDDRRPSAPLPALRSSRWLLPLGLVFAGIYLLFDLREGGRTQSVTTTSIVSPGRYVHLFGARYTVAMIATDLALGLLAAALLITAIAAQQRRRRLGSCCSVAAGLGVGFAVFGCPGCLVPLAGTVGLSLFAGALPLLGVELKLTLGLCSLLALLLLRRPGRRWTPR